MLNFCIFLELILAKFKFKYLLITSSLIGVIFAEFNDYNYKDQLNLTVIENVPDNSIWGFSDFESYQYSSKWKYHYQARIFLSHLFIDRCWGQQPKIVMVWKKVGCCSYNDVLQMLIPSIYPLNQRLRKGKKLKSIVYIIQNC